jgi:hypothetical protein
MKMFFVPYELVMSFQEEKEEGLGTQAGSRSGKSHHERLLHPGLAARQLSQQSSLRKHTLKGMFRNLL